jgi:hypothetical protein
VRAVVLRVVSGNSAQGLSRDPIVYLHSALLPSWNLVLVPSLLPEMWSRFYLSFLECGPSSISPSWILVQGLTVADAVLLIRSLCAGTVYHITLHYITSMWRVGYGEDVERSSEYVVAVNERSNGSSRCDGV